MTLEQAKEKIMESLVTFTDSKVKEIVPISARKGKNLKELMKDLIIGMMINEK